MRRVSPKTKGFALVELLIILVLLVAVGAVGAYAYHRSHSAKKVANSSNTSHNNSTQTNQNNSESTQADKSVFKAPELGIEIINVPESLQDLTSASAGTDSAGTSIFFSTTSLTNLAPACSASHGALASVTRFNGAHSSGDGTIATFVKQFDGFWIGYAPGTDRCWGDDEQASNLAHSQRQSFNALVTNPDNLQALN